MSHEYAYCKVSISPVRAEPKDQSEISTQLLFGELITVHEINFPWAKITTQSDGYTGYIDHKHFIALSEKEAKRWLDGLSYLYHREESIQTPWGMQRICRGSYIPKDQENFMIGKDHFSIRKLKYEEDMSVLKIAMDYINTPYLWGGKSPFGIDCSGITQVIYRLFDVNLPRDASEQVHLGTEIELEDSSEGDLAFFENNNGKITHVGILNGKDGIIHAAGYVRLDKITSEGIINIESNKLTHKLYCVKRI